MAEPKTITLSVRHQLPYHSEADWTSTYDRVLLRGEVAFTVDNGRHKIGDGVKKWSELDYVPQGETGDSDFGIVANEAALPSTFTVADRKLYFSIEDGFFWLWNGAEWKSLEPIAISNAKIDALFE